MSKLLQGKWRQLLWALSLLIFSSHAFADQQAGLDWLTTQQAADGSYTATTFSLATPIQSVSEVIRAQQETNQPAPDYAAALLYLNNDTALNTEYLARKIIVNAKAGNDVTTLINDLIARQNPDGGFGNKAGYPSSVFDTALALQALTSSGQDLETSTRSAAQYLISLQLNSGGWQDGENTESVYLSTLAVDALTPFRYLFFGPAAAIANGRDYLFGQQQADGGWGEGFQSAMVIGALVPNVTSVSVLDTAITHLQQAQSVDGSWVQDVFTTALALRAIAMFENSSNQPIDTSKSAAMGRVVLSGSLAPIGDALITINEVPGLTAQTQTDGSFLFTGLEPGQYTLVATKAGYSAASTVIVTSMGDLTHVPVLVLNVAPGNGVIIGQIIDNASGKGLSNVSAILGTVLLAANSDSSGGFELNNIIPGTYTLTLSKSGYNSVTQSISVAAGQATNVRVSMTAQGSYDDTAGIISGEVVDGISGQPIANAQINIGSGYTTTTNSTGQFDITDVARGSYASTVSAIGYQPTSIAFTFSSVTGGNMGTIALFPTSDVTQPDTVTLFGTVLNEQTLTPIMGATIELLGVGNTVTSDNNGIFTLTGIASQNFDLVITPIGQAQVIYTVSAPGWGLTSSTFLISSSINTGTTYSATAIVVDASTNLAMAGVAVSADFGGTPITTTTDGTGRFTLANLSTDRGTINFDYVGYNPQSLPVTLAPLTLTDLGQVRLRQTSEPLPDLVVSSVDTSTFITDLSTLNVSGVINASIQNIGDIETGQTAQIVAFYDTNKNNRYDAGLDTKFGEISTSSTLSQGASEVVNIAVNGTIIYRDAPIKVHVDPSNEIEEKSDNNNVAQNRGACIVTKPAVGLIDPVIKWEYPGFTTTTAMVSPLEDTNADGVINELDEARVISIINNYVTVLRGSDGSLVWQYTDHLASEPGSALAVGDVDGDGTPEIVTTTQVDDRLLVLNADGTLKHYDPDGPIIRHSHSGMLLADLEGDGLSEYLISGNVLNNDGSLRFSTLDWYGQSLPVAVDLDLDGIKEVIISNKVFRADGTLLFEFSPTYVPFRSYPTIVNLDDDPYPEIVVVGYLKLTVLEHDGTTKWGPITMKSGVRNGSAPTIADFDGDGLLDIAVGGNQLFTVYNSDGTIKWEAQTSDPSTGVNGSAAFDLNGDGIMELAHVDAYNFFLFNGASGEVIFKQPTGSATWLENPVIADIDNDGHAEIVVPYGKGIRVYEDRHDSWKDTRSIWNQLNYHVTNINDDLSIPVGNIFDWQVNNTYRAASKKPLPEVGPDLTISVLRYNGFNGAVNSFSARIGNASNLETKQGLSVVFYKGEPGTGGIEIGSVILPVLGSDTYTDVSISSAVDISGPGEIVAIVDPYGLQDECDRTNNRMSIPAPDVMPDLVIDSLDKSSVIENPLTLGVSGFLIATVKNTGGSTAVGAVELLAYHDLNSNNLFDLGSDIKIGHTSLSLNLSSQLAQNVQINISATLPFRDAPISVWVDSSENIKEGREDNNTATSASLCVTAPQPLAGIDPVVKWHWNTSSILPAYNQVMMAPVVAQTNDDNGDGKIDANDIPDVIFNAYGGTAFGFGAGILRIVSGADGSEIVAVANLDYRLTSAGNIAVGDIDGDGLIEIVAPKYGGGVIVFEHDGTLKWINTDLISSVWEIGGPSIADIDHDGTPEIVFGSLVINADGTTRWRGRDGYLKGSTHYNASMSTVADIDNSGDMEVIVGASVYNSDGTLRWINTAVRDGFTGVGNFDADPFAEIVVVRIGSVYLLDHLGNIIWGPVAIPGGGRGGAPTIADMDGDGQPEIGIAGAYNYFVLETDGTVKWTAPVRDISSNITGSSVFDFNGDGASEIIYADEHNLWIFNGADGQVIYSIPNPSGTAAELPVVADIDNDGHAELIVASNAYYGGTTRGIRVFESVNDDWMPTRSIWNQHSYHITNINDDGTIPQYEEPSWLSHNTYRLNTFPGTNPLAQADLTIGRPEAIDNPAAQGLSIKARVGNAGGQTTFSDVVVTAYAGDPQAGGVELGATTISRLAAGKFIDVTISNITTYVGGDLYIRVDSTDVVPECNEANNIVILPATSVVSANGALLVATDNSQYGPDAAVVIQGLVSNTGSLTGDYVVNFNITDTQGALVTTFLASNVTGLGSGLATTVTTGWSTGRIIAGNYILHGVLQDVDGTAIANASSNFSITAADPVTSFSINAATDKTTYHTTDQVIIESLVQNQSANTIVSGASVNVLVTDAGGAVISNTTHALNSDLLPNSTRTITSNVLLAGVAEGNYSVSSRLLDGSGTTLASDTASFIVASDLEQALTASVEVAASTIIGGNTQTCTATLTNNGVTDINNLNVHFILSDITAGTLVSDEISPISLLPGASTTITRTIDTTGMPEHDYACLIQINSNGADETLGYATYTVIPAAYADVTIALDRAVYHTTDTVTITQTINNITVSTPVAGASLQTEIRDSANQIVFTFNTVLATLDAGASITIAVPYTYINNAAGIYRAIARVISNTGVELAASEQTFTIRDMIAESLTASLALGALEVQVGDPQSCIATLSNTGHFDITNLDVMHRITSAAGSIITSNPYQLSIAQSQGTTLTLNQATDNLALGAYQCLLLANIAGTLTELASATFTIAVPPISLEGELSVGDRGRVLILLDQSPADAPDEQRMFIEQLLTEANWSFTLTEDPIVFESEFNSGGYQSYGLFGEVGKLTEDTQTALREAVFRGEGLLVAGPHDNRNIQTPRINEALGLKITGLFNNAVEVAINIGALSNTGDTLNLLTGEQVSRIQLDGAVVHGQYYPETIVNPATCDDPLTCRAAITAYDYGRGRSVFAGFDLLANATLNGNASVAAQLILDALTHIHPALIEETTGSVIPIQLTVSNLGVDADVRASVVLPPEVTVIDAVDAIQTGQTLNWNLLLQANMQATWQAWIQLPEIVGPISLNATIEGAVPNTGLYQLQANPVLSLDVLATPTLTEVDEQLANLETNGIGAANRISQARKSLARANTALPDDPVKAFNEGLKAADSLTEAGAHPDIDAARIMLGQWLWGIARQLP